MKHKNVALAARLHGQARARTKYNSRKMVVNGITFDSQKEAARYQELLLLQQAGKIRNLRLQPQFTLMEGFKDALTGETIRPIRYIADFQYEEHRKIVWADPDGGEDKITWEWWPVVEDVKGKKTADYENKRKMMLDKFGIRISET